MWEAVQQTAKSVAMARRSCDGRDDFADDALDPGGDVGVDPAVSRRYSRAGDRGVTHVGLQTGSSAATSWPLANHDLRLLTPWSAGYAEFRISAISDGGVCALPCVFRC